MIKPWGVGPHTAVLELSTLGALSTGLSPDEVNPRSPARFTLPHIHISFRNIPGRSDEKFRYSSITSSNITLTSKFLPKPKKVLLASRGLWRMRIAYYNSWCYTNIQWMSKGMENILSSCPFPLVISSLPTNSTTMSRLITPSWTSSLSPQLQTQSFLPRVLQNLKPSTPRKELISTPLWNLLLHLNS